MSCYATPASASNELSRRGNSAKKGIDSTIMPCVKLIARDSNELIPRWLSARVGHQRLPHSHFHPRPRPDRVRRMFLRLLHLSVLVSFLIVDPTWAQESEILVAVADRSADQQAPVRMGSGIMTFDTVPGWGLRPDGNSPLGPTHGGVVVDEGGNIYTSADAGIYVFSPDGQVVQSYLGGDYTRIHDIEIRKEGDHEFIYGARNKDAEGIKFNAHSGEVVLRLPFPEDSGLTLEKFSPTAITVAPKGDIYLSDGYASNYVFKFDKDGNYQSHFGSKGNGMKQFNTAHGMTLDTRYDPPRLLICDRNHKPKGRLLHYDLDGNFMEEVVTGLGMPTSVAIQGEYVSVPDLYGRLVILDGTNTIMSVLGFNADPKTAASYKVPQKDWVEGIFSGTHGSYWDNDGNLYVQDWNISGRLMKLVRVQ